MKTIVISGDRQSGKTIAALEWLRGFRKQAGDCVFISPTAIRSENALKLFVSHFKIKCKNIDRDAMSVSLGRNKAKIYFAMPAYMRGVSYCAAVNDECGHIDVNCEFMCVVTQTANKEVNAA